VQAGAPYQQQQPVQAGAPYQQQPPTQAGASYPPAQQNLQPQAPTKKKKSPLKIVLIVAGILLLGCIITFIAVFGAASCSLNKTADAAYYEIGGDQVPSVKTALGTIYDVTSVATSNNNGMETLDIAFKTDGNSGTEMQSYAAYLSSQGWLRVQDADFSQASNPKSAGLGFQLAKNSTTSGYVVVMTLYWEPGSFNLVIDRLEGDVASEGGSTTGDNISLGGNGSGGSEQGGSSGSDQSDLWAPGYFNTLNSGHYAMGMNVHTESSASDVSASLDLDFEVYVSGSKSAMLMEFMGMTIRYVFDGTTQYMIDDSSRQVQVSSAEESFPVPDTSGMVFVSAGQDVFRGSTMYCEVWQSPSGTQTKWFFDTENQWIEGFTNIADDGTITEVYIAWLQTDFDESIFNIPSDYTVIQG
jgi:hypothetical protein